MTTRLRPYAGPGLVHFVSTLVVCGVAVLIAPPVAAASVTVDVSLVAGAAVSADQTSTDHAWSAEVIAPDVPDSSDDDDGGDDAPGASAAVVQASLSSHNSGGDRWHLLHTLMVSCASQTRDGHSLRGPPCVTGDASDVDEDDCGHDQDMTPFTAAPPYSNPFRRFPGNSLLSGACDGPSMRAP